MAPTPESPQQSDEPIALPGRAERIAQRVHALCGQGADLEFLITVLVGEVESSMDLLTAVLRHCTRRVPGDPEWQRATTAVQVTMGTGLLRWT